MIKSGEYEIKPLEESEIEWARIMHNDPEVLKMLTDPHEVSAEEQKKWFEGLRNSKSSARWVAHHKGEKVGVIRLDAIDHHNLSLMIGLDIHKDHRGKGHAKHIYNLVMDYWFFEKNFHRVWLKVAEYNEVAHHIYKKLGFKEEGRERDAIKRFGKFNDYIIMSILADEYKDDK